jgi:hypothetical protein
MVGANTRHMDLIWADQKQAVNFVHKKSGVVLINRCHVYTIGGQNWVSLKISIWHSKSRKSIFGHLALDNTEGLRVLPFTALSKFLRKKSHVAENLWGD